MKHVNDSIVKKSRPILETSAVAMDQSHYIGTRLSAKQFLTEEVKPALGCTEPVAVALAVARAREELAGEVTDIEVQLSSNVFKNGATVGIPGTNGLKGNKVAAALAVFTGNSSDGLQVLKDLDLKILSKATRLVETNKVQMSVHPAASGVYVKATVKNERHTASTQIEGSHDNITEVELDGKTVYRKTGSEEKKHTPVSELLTSMSWEETAACVNDMDAEDISFLLTGAEMNFEIAEAGFEPNTGLGIGRTIKASAPDFETADMGLRIKAWSAAASDARMSGVPMAVMSSAGSGNHGITAILPVAYYGRAEKMDDKSIATGLLISHLATSYVKSRTGRLSTTCGCAFAAGAGAAAGLTWLMTKDIRKSNLAIEIVVSNLIGMLCDGAKETCAFKVGTGALEAYHAALIAAGSSSIDSQGIIGINLEDTIRNAGKVASNMDGIEKVLLEIAQTK